jgi:hypothetical protein
MELYGLSKNEFPTKYTSSYGKHISNLKQEDNGKYYLTGMVESADI